PIVRTEARRLRARLSDYYDVASDSLVIELPKGGYVPVIRPLVQPVTNAIVAPERQGSRPMWPAIVTGIAILAFAIVGWTRLGPGDYRSVGRAEALDLYLSGRTL